MIKFTVPLIPTPFNLDVWVGKDLNSVLSKAYSNYEDEGHVNFTAVYNKKGVTTVVMVLDSNSLEIIVHEIVHVLHFLHEICGLEFEGEEWCAYFQSNLFAQITSKINKHDRD